jgi:flagellar protein FlaG
MTEIGKISSDAQVSDLRTPTAANQASGAVDRFSGSPAQPGRHSTDVVETQLIGPKGAAAGEEVTPFERAAEALQKFLPEEDKLPNTRLRINKDDETGRFVYQNVDAESGEVIRQFPPESILEFLSYYREVAGLAVDDEA